MRTDAEWNVGIFTLAWTCSKISKSVVNSSNHWCLKKWRSRPTFTWVNLSEFWGLMKRHASFVFWSFQRLMETGVSLQCHVLKKSTLYQTWKWFSCCRVISSFFQKFSFTITNFDINARNEHNMWKRFLPVKLTAGADKAIKVRVGDFNNIWLVKSHYCVITVREMKCTSHQCCGKTMDGKMALNCEFCFPNCTKSWRIKLLS